MKRRLLNQLLLAGAIAGSLARPAGAQGVELSGVRFEPTLQLAGARLVLNGAGIRYKAIFKVYAAALYLSAPAGTPEAVAGAAGPRRLRLVMYRDIDANELGKLFTQGMERNMSREDFARSINGTVRMGELFARRKRLAPNDVIDLDWLPGRGTQVSINGRDEIEPIKEPEFFHALLSIWLGRSPADGPLRDALLGRSTARPFGQ